MIMLSRFGQFNSEFPVLLSQSWFWWESKPC